MLKKEHSLPLPALFALGCLVGAFAFFVLYGVSTLDVTYDQWLREGYVEKDCIQHYTGWLFYRQSPLSFPFCVAPQVNWPDGISVAYTDSIPLFAVFFRLLAPLLPAVFQYFGWFTLLCFMLQGGFAALLLSLFSSCSTLVLLGSVPFVFSPILVERAYRHTSLAAQFFILWALYCYIKSLREGRAFSWGLAAASFFSASIHPYITAMVLALGGALVLDVFLRQYKWKKTILSFLAYCASCAAAAFMFGLATGSSSGGSDVEYGYFSMNLNALWNPTSRWDLVWSRVLPVQNQVGGNYDAFNYLGLGILCACLLVGASLLLRAKQQLPACLLLVKNHLGLLAMCAFCTVFAVTNIVTANGATLLRIPLPHAIVRLFTVFRSSGRMFWPVYYLIFLCCFLFICRLFRRKTALLLLAGLVVVQLWDISPALAERSREMRRYQTEYPSPLTSGFWADAAEQYDHILSLDSLQDAPLFLALYAADNGMTTNDPFAARYSEAGLAAQRAELIDEIKAGTLRQDSLYLVENEGLFWELADFAKDKALCGRLQNSEHNWYVIAPGLEYSGNDFLPFSEEYPLHIEDYSDDNWLHGVLMWDNKTVTFRDCAFTRRKLETAAALVCEGKVYPITAFSDKDAGWLMITLEIEDANLLVGKDLESVTP